MSNRFNLALLTLVLITGVVMFLGRAAVVEDFPDDLPGQRGLRAVAMESYSQHFDPATEQTDIIVDMYYSLDVATIDSLAEGILKLYAPESLGRREGMSELNAELEALIGVAARSDPKPYFKLWRERAYKHYYRLDVTILSEFGTFVPGDPSLLDTNSYEESFFNHGDRSKGSFENYSIIPRQTHAMLNDSPGSRLENQWVYGTVSSLPPMLQSSFQLSTIDTDYGAKIKRMVDAGFYLDSNDTHLFRPDPGKVDLLVNKWYTTERIPKLGVFECYSSERSARARKGIRLLLDDSRPGRKHFASLYGEGETFPDELSVWNFDAGSQAVSTFVRIHRESGGGRKSAQVLRVLHMAKTQEVDEQIYRFIVPPGWTHVDKRPEYPIETVDGKFVRKWSKANTAPSAAYIESKFKLFSLFFVIISATVFGFVVWRGATSSRGQ